MVISFSGAGTCKRHILGLLLAFASLLGTPLPRLNQFPRLTNFESFTSPVARTAPYFCLRQQISRIFNWWVDCHILLLGKPYRYL
jgi:hypothetical protein